MTADPPSFFSREELLGGLPARRASTVLFAIEARTAHLVARTQHAMAFYETERASSERERAFLAAMASGRELPAAVSVQDLERFASRWADLVPSATDVRAALVRLLAQKYTLVRGRTWGIRAALGVDDPAVAAAFTRLHGAPIASIEREAIPPSERLRWWRSSITSRVEDLPPFWMAYTLALTETVGQGVLALPIALAGVGPIPAVVFLVVMGLLNVLTIGALVETITRNGAMRYGTTYFGRLAGMLLGREASVGISAALFAVNAVTFLAYLIGFSAPLADASGLPLGACAAVLFVVNLFFLRRDLNATVASAIVIGIVNVCLIAAIAFVAFAHVDVDRVAYIRLPFGADAAPVGAFALAFGVVLVAYFGHTSAGNIAKIVLARDPSGRALLRGNVAAVLTVVVLYSVAIVSILGAVPRNQLIGYGGTALEPLAERAGPAVTVLGTVFAILAIGLGSIYVSLGLFNQVREWLPRSPSGTSRWRRRWTALASSEFGGFVVATTPVVVVFVILEWMIATETVSLADPISLIGSLALPLLGGVFPMLLLAAARRHGDRVPRGRVGALAGPVSIAIVAIVFSVGLLIQGLVIWQTPVERVATLFVAVAIGVIAWRAARAGAFGSRATIEIRREANGMGVANVTVGGEHRSVPVRVTTADGEHATTGDDAHIGRFDEVERLSVELPGSGARGLTVWIHRVTVEGDSEGMPALVHGRGKDASAEARTSVDDPRIALPYEGDDLDVRIVMEGTTT